MSKSRRLTFAQIRSAFRLVGEVAELGPNWRVHYLLELAKLTGSQVAMGGDAMVRNNEILIPGAIDLGWATESDHRVYWDFMSNGLHRQEPTVPPTLANPDAVWTRTRRMFIAPIAIIFGRMVSAPGAKGITATGCTRVIPGLRTA